MKREAREGLLALGVAIFGFVVPVSIGAAWREPVTPYRAGEPLRLEGPLPADGVWRLSSVDDHGRGQWPDECVQWEIRPADRSVPNLRRALVDRFDFLLESPSETPCAERMPYEEQARCEHRYTTGLRLENGERIELSVTTVAHYYDPEDRDREWCERQRGARWTEAER